MRAFVFVPVILMLMGFSDVRGQEAPKNEKPKNGKEIAVAYMLGEPDRLLKEFAAAKDELVKAKDHQARGVVTPGWSPGSEVAYCQKQLSQLEARLERARAGDISIPQLLAPNPNDKRLLLEECRVGKMGIIALLSPPYNYSLEATIYQIIDKDNMLVRFEEQYSVAYGQHHTESKIVLIKMPTNGHTDDEKLSFDHPFVVSGTYQYETPVGAKTVLVFEQIDPEWLKAEVKKRLPLSTVKRIDEVLATAAAERNSVEDRVRTERARAEVAAAKAEADKKAAEAKAEADRQAAALRAEFEAQKKAVKERVEANRKAAAVEEAKWRTWTDSTGKFRTKAMFGGMAGGKVKLIKSDGSTVRVPLENLSEEDQEWTRNKSH